MPSWQKFRRGDVAMVIRTGKLIPRGVLVEVLAGNQVDNVLARMDKPWQPTYFCDVKYLAPSTPSNPLPWPWRHCMRETDLEYIGRL